MTTGCINTDCRFCILNCSKVGLISRFLLSWNYSLGMRKLFNSATSLKIHKVLDWRSSEEKSYILVTFFLTYSIFQKILPLNIFTKNVAIQYHQMCTINFQINLRQ